MANQDNGAAILGLGLDGTDGHIRLTNAANFHLVGGSHDTHQHMQETCMKFNEKLHTRGKALEDLEHRELLDLAAECQMNLVTPGSAVRRNTRR